MPTGAIVALSIIGALLAVAAFFALRYARSERRKADRSAGTETSTCGDVANLAGSVAGEVGGQLFRQRCEIVGRARAEQAELAAPFSKQPCVWHRSQIIHHYWEYRTDTDSRGNRTRRRQERQRVLSDQTSQAPFLVDDGTGALPVDAREADMDQPEQVHDHFESDTSPQAGSAFSAFGVSVNLGADSGSLGYQHIEWILRPGAQLYLLGDVTDASGRLMLGKPDDGGDLVVSTRSEEEFVGAARKHAQWATIGAAAGGLIGAGMLIAALVGLLVS